MPAGLVQAACEEIERDMQPGQWERELQHSFYSSRRGRLRRKAGPELFPKCFLLMRETEKAFGITDQILEDVQVAVRRYVPNDGTTSLEPHFDSVEMFGEPVLPVIL